MDSKGYELIKCRSCGGIPYDYQGIAFINMIIQEIYVLTPCIVEKQFIYSHMVLMPKPINKMNCNVPKSYIWA